MEKIGQLLLNRPTTQKKGIQHEWQAFAYKIWAEYSGDAKELKNIMRFVRTYNKSFRGFIDIAYNFCKDYNGKIPKLKLFYWKFWQLKRGLSG